jgi:hypothetical protein
MLIQTLSNKNYFTINRDLIKAIGVFSIPIYNIFFLFIIIYYWLEERNFWNKKL